MRKTKNPLFLILLIGTLAVSCHSQKKIKGNAIATQETTETNSDVDCKKLLLNSDLIQAQKTDPFKIKTATINGSCIDIKLNYGGGCGEVDFQLIWDGQLMESSPQQIRLFLSLKDYDRCKALKIKHYQFDLASLREKFPIGKIVLHLINYPEPITFE